MKTVYIWKATQAEPGQNGHTFAATSTPVPPKNVECQKVPGTDGLAYQESFYSDWSLIGTVKGECWINRLDEHIVEAENGRIYTAQEVVISGVMTPIL